MRRRRPPATGAASLQHTNASNAGLYTSYISWFCSIVVRNSIALLQWSTGARMIYLLYLANKGGCHSKLYCRPHSSIKQVLLSHHSYLRQRETETLSHHKQHPARMTMCNHPTQMTMPRSTTDPAPLRRDCGSCLTKVCTSAKIVCALTCSFATIKCMRKLRCVRSKRGAANCFATRLRCSLCSSSW